jgi:cystathionine beta-synthase
MQVLSDILEAVGNTPLVRLSRLMRTERIRTPILAKIEYLNPGGSIKDRIAVAMVERAERDGILKPGGTIVEPTSGNTGTGLAIAARLKGYQMIAVMPDKMSREKIDLLRAYGAEVVICPTAVEPESPESYYSVSDRLAREVPGAWKPNQYANQTNPQAHYDTTGPEIWEATGGEITHYVAGVGTGGTITGAARYLRERKPDIVVVGADPEGSIYSGDEVRPYLTEGVGEDFWPTTFDPDVVDRWERVTDRDAFLATRRLASVEAILTGGSGGTALVGALRTARVVDDPDALVVVILPDGGRSYLSKIYNDDWMRAHGFIETDRRARVTVGEVLRAKHDDEVPPLITVDQHQVVRDAISLLQTYRVSQLPVVAGDTRHGVIGSIGERGLLERVFSDPQSLAKEVFEVMEAPFPAISADQAVEEAYSLLARERSAVLVTREGGGDPVGILTRSDLLEAMVS